MKKLLLSIISTLFITNTYACTNPTASDYKALMAATGFNQPAVASKLANTYCYNLTTFDFKRMKSEHPIFFSPTVDFLKFYVANSRDVTQHQSREFKLDILSKILISPYASYYVSNEQQKNDSINFIKKYEPSASVAWYNNPYQTIDNPKERYNNQNALNNRRQMINYLIPIYSRLSEVPKDANQNSVLYFSMITNEYPVFKNLAINDSDFYNRNVDGYTLFHLAFGPHVYAGNQEEGQANLKKINDIIVSRFKLSYMSYLTFKDIPFEYFIDMMQENNPDLYQKLKAKINFSIDGWTQKSYQGYKPSTMTALNYLQRID